MVFFQFPDSSQLYTLKGTPGEDEFSLISFDSKKTLSFQGRLEVISEEAFRAIPLSLKELDQSPRLREETKEDYINKVQEAIDWTNKNNLEKLVLSRRKIVPIDNVSLVESFLSLKAAYPSAPSNTLYLL